MIYRRGFHARIQSEGYCCPKGYLELCQARGETPINMAINLEMSAATIWYHYRQLREGKLVCANREDCLKPLIKDVKKPPKSEAS